MKFALVVFWSVFVFVRIFSVVTLRVFWSFLAMKLFAEGILTFLVISLFSKMIFRAFFWFLLWLAWEIYSALDEQLF